MHIRATCDEFPDLPQIAQFATTVNLVAVVF